jgi:hypothetical protein
MGLGGPFCFISAMQLSNAFPQNGGQVLSILTGSFDASSCVFLLYRLAYYDGFPITPRTFFLSYLFFPILSIIVQLLFMPNDSYKSEFEIAAEAAERRAQPRRVSETTALLGEGEGGPYIHSHPAAAGAIESEIVETFGAARRASVFSIPQNRRVSYDVQPAHPHVRNPVTGIMHGKKPLEQIKSPWWMYFPFVPELIVV